MFRPAACAAEEAFESARCYVSHVLCHSEKTLRFEGRFGYGKLSEGSCMPLPRVALLVLREGDVTTFRGVVRIVEVSQGPSTNVYDGRTSNRLRVGRILAAAAKSAPFEPIPEVDPPGQEEIDAEAAEDAERTARMESALRRREAGEAVNSDDEYDICFFSSNVIDVRYEPI
jgi:hypothetical protein